MKKNSAFFLICLLIIILAFFVRFYNLDYSGVFLWDNSYDLMKIHQYFKEKTFTIIGPISEDGSKVFSSLTYYMLMPFAVIFNFDPVSTTIGAAFWGFLTFLLILFLVKIINPEIFLISAFLASIWFPLVETSRWAWNPNLIPFWITLGLIFFHWNNSYWRKFFAGLFFGLSIHNHYLSFIACIVFLLLSPLALNMNKKPWKQLIFLFLGFFFALSPFIVFDLTHKPGLFLSRFFYFMPFQKSFNLFVFLKELNSNLIEVFFYYTHNRFFIWITLFLILSLLVYDFKKDKKNLVYILPWISQVLFVTFLKNSFSHYFLPGLIFFFFYLIIPRERIGKIFAKVLISIFIFTSLFTVFSQIKNNPYVFYGWKPNIRTVREIVITIERAIKENKLNNVNLAVLGSVDPNTYGWKYRNLLLIRGINLKTRDEYFSSDFLFVISQLPEGELRKDPASEMTNFRDGLLLNRWDINDTGWSIYLFEKEKK